MASVEVPDGTNLVGRGLLVCLVLPTNVVDAAVAADHDLVARAHCRRLARISISDHDWLRDIAPAGTSRVREPFPVGNDRPLPRFGIWRSGAWSPPRGDDPDRLRPFHDDLFAFRIS